MVVAIAGAHGKIGLRLGRMLAMRGDRVLGLIRNPDHADHMRTEGAEPVVCDLEAAEPGAIAGAIVGADAVVFAAGAGPGSGAERKETMDYEGAVKLIEAAEAAGARRYVMVSAMAADPRYEGDEVFAVYMRAKGRADAELRASGLDYTIVQPGALTDTTGTGRVHIAPEAERGEIPRDDVAAVLAATLADPATVGHTFQLVSGADQIERALAKLTGRDG